MSPPSQVQLSPDQCGSPKWTPCYNVYAVNETHGDLVWFAFTTSSAAVKGMHLVRGVPTVGNTCNARPRGGAGWQACRPGRGQHLTRLNPTDVSNFQVKHRPTDSARMRRGGNSSVVCCLCGQGRHSVYYSTWSGPGLYAVNPTNGHVRWQFPLDNWFRYW